MFNAFTVIIRGRVQGVGFRYFAQDIAKSSNLTGWVRNLPDGSVEVLGYGPPAILERFLQHLKMGPVGSRVDSAQFQWLELKEEYKTFEIRP